MSARERVSQSSRELSAFSVAQKCRALSSAETLALVDAARVNRQGRSYDVYAFADYRGNSGDVSSCGIALVLLMGGQSPVHVADIKKRRHVAAFWSLLLSAAEKRGLRVLFGQDHQYGVPFALREELQLSGAWRTAMEELFVSGRFGLDAVRGYPGRFAAAVNHALVEEGRSAFFYSHQNGERYGIPRANPRPEKLYRLTELADAEHSPKTFGQIGDNGTVGGQSIVGLPYLLQLLRSPEGQKVHVWPFDGFAPRANRHVLLELYPSALRPSAVPQTDLNDALGSVLWLRRMDHGGGLKEQISAKRIPPSQRSVARWEGWYLAG